jgi:hypothetical protein
VLPAASARRRLAVFMCLKFDERKAALRCDAPSRRGMRYFLSFQPDKENFGAGEGIRTLDPDLGKVVLYP